MSGFKRVTGGKRLNKADANGVSGLVFVTHFMESTVKGKADAKTGQQREYQVLAANSFLLEDVNVSLAAPKNDEEKAMMGENTPIPFKAMEQSQYIKLFGSGKLGFVPMSVYNFVGIVRTSFVDKTTGEVRESLNVAQMRPTQRQLSEFLPSIPFENRCFRPERDFIQEITEVGAFVIELKHRSVMNTEVKGNLTIDDDWYPSQPEGSTWATSQCNQKETRLNFRFDDKLPYEDGILEMGSKESGDPICLYTRQKNKDGTAITVAVYSRLGPNTVRFFQTDNWKEVGSKFVPHLEGTVVCSTNIKSTQTLMNPDESLFGNYIQVNGDMIPNLANMVKNAGIKVSRKVVSEVVNCYSSAEKLDEPVGASAHNLTCVDFTEDRMMDMLDDSKYDYYLVGNYVKGQEKVFMQLDNDETKCSALTNKTDEVLVWEDDDNRVVNVYAVKKTNDQTDVQTEKRQKLDSDDEDSE